MSDQGQGIGHRTAVAVIELPVWINEAAGPLENGESCDAIRLELWVRDPELAAALVAVSEGRRREEFALGALKIGVLALRQAQGRVDAEAVRNEGERLIANLAAQLA